MNKSLLSNKREENSRKMYLKIELKKEDNKREDKEYFCFKEKLSKSKDNVRGFSCLKCKKWAYKEHIGCEEEIGMFCIILCSL